MIVYLKSKFTYLLSKKDHDCLFVFKHKTIWSWNEQEKQLEDIEFRHKQRRHFRNVPTFARFSCPDVTMAGELGLAELTSSPLPPGSAHLLMKMHFQFSVSGVLGWQIQNGGERQDSENFVVYFNGWNG